MIRNRRLFIVSLGLLLLLLLIVLISKIKIYTVQGCSMEPCLSSGDRLIVYSISPYANQSPRSRFTDDCICKEQKLAFQRNNRKGLKQGDIVVFETPNDQKIVVKRILGIPGDTINQIDRMPISEPTHSDSDTKHYGTYGNDLTLGAFENAIILPTRDSKVHIDQNNLKEYQSIIDGHNSLSVGWDLGELAIRGSDNNYVTFEQGYYYLIGDNLDHSKDSRHYGCIPGKSISGKVICKF
ncbi:MAG: signal peptidase I [candidate division Zixibacteria bacterium]|nr:signal peptidase I [candidate division Zixibacteria bacterium]